jgi:hypothetical protein
MRAVLGRGREGVGEPLEAADVRRLLTYLDRQGAADVALAAFHAVKAMQPLWAGALAPCWLRWWQSHSRLRSVMPDMLSRRQPRGHSLGALLRFTPPPALPRSQMTACCAPS